MFWLLAPVFYLYHLFTCILLLPVLCYLYLYISVICTCIFLLPSPLYCNLYLLLSVPLIYLHLFVNHIYLLPVPLFALMFLLLASFFYLHHPVTCYFLLFLPSWLLYLSVTCTFFITLLLLCTLYLSVTCIIAANIWYYNTFCYFFLSVFLPVHCLLSLHPTCDIITLSVTYFSLLLTYNLSVMSAANIWHCNISVNSFLWFLSVHCLLSLQPTYDIVTFLLNLFSGTYLYTVCYLCSLHVSSQHLPNPWLPGEPHPSALDPGHSSQHRLLHDAHVDTGNSGICFLYRTHTRYESINNPINKYFCCHFIIIACTH